MKALLAFIIIGLSIAVLWAMVKASYGKAQRDVAEYFASDKRPSLFTAYNVFGCAGFISMILWFFVAINS